ncbi:hypothetical protein [Sulfurimonas sp.]|uniref:hypothetical protein n=1 Tax=Sulfurimonas sp. TaxID=2022749 RepID=UPI002635FED8|nr:hypothetical protein [Sulfurimonas sp.]MCW8895015.1 hypothetical protein [Sulfurimonas sp.]
MDQDLNITETAANTIAVNVNTAFIVISTAIVFALAIWGYKKYKGMNIIKKTINEFGEISQNGKDNIIDDVDNTNGKISQS